MRKKTSVSLQEPAIAASRWLLTHDDLLSPMADAERAMAFVEQLCALVASSDMEVFESWELVGEIVARGRRRLVSAEERLRMTITADLLVEGPVVELDVLRGLRRRRATEEEEGNADAAAK